MKDQKMQHQHRAVRGTHVPPPTRRALGAMLSVGVTGAMLAACAAPGQQPSASPPQLVSVTDLAGRQVQVNIPAQKVVVQLSGSGGPFLSLLALEHKNIARRIAGWDSGLKLNRRDMYDKFVAAVPDLATVPEIGNIDDNTFNVEKVIALKPDVLFASLIGVTAAKETIDRLAGAGIPTVIIDYHKETLENHTRSIKLIGQIIGQDQRAQELATYYANQTQKVTSRLATLNKPRPSVHLELAQDPAVYGNSYSDSLWGILMENAGGNNIAKGKVGASGPLQAEYVLSSNPDVIVFAGSYWPDKPSSVKLGYTAAAATSLPFLTTFTKRPGWETLNAVKNGRVHSVNHGLARDVWDFYPLQYFAKSFYPADFKDLDPEGAFKEFHLKFLPLAVSGVWTQDLNQA